MTNSQSTSHQPDRPGEFELIAALKRLIDQSPAPPDVLLGIGDDAAAVNFHSGTQVLTTDTMVDGVHFRSSEADWEDVGWKSAVSNLSDIAAMGAAPLHALVTIGVPDGVALADMERLYRGMTAAFAEFGGGIIGGDVVSSPVAFVTVALTGRAAEVDGVPVLLQRDAAQPGDLVGVTGKLGGPAGGLRALMEGLSGADADALRRSHFRPVPRVAEGRALIESGVRCAMDVSDGLVGDLEKLCAASVVGAVINSAEVPAPEELRSLFGEEATELALTGGEDYQLVFTVPFDLMDRLLARNRGMFTHIGRIVDEPDTVSRVQVLDRNGSELELKRTGWDHLGTK